MKIVFILVLSIITINVFSAHLENRPVELKQPNGEIINCFVTGDEYHRRVHDSKNYTIIKIDWKYGMNKTKESSEIAIVKYFFEIKN